MVQKILFLTVPSNNILNMGFFYYCLFSIFMVTPSVIFLVWYPLRNKYTNFRSGQKWQSTLNIPSLKISVAKVSHTLYFQQKFYNTFPWITAVNHLKDISFSFCHYFRFFIPCLWDCGDLTWAGCQLWTKGSLLLSLRRIEWKVRGLRQGQGETTYQLSSQAKQIQLGETNRITANQIRKE